MRELRGLPLMVSIALLVNQFGCGPLEDRPAAKAAAKLDVARELVHDAREKQDRARSPGAPATEGAETTKQGQHEGPRGIGSGRLRRDTITVPNR